MSVDIIIIIVIVAAALGFAIYHVRKIINGKGGCSCGCGGSSGSMPAKKIDSPIAKKIIGIEGMHCDHCKNAVEKGFNRLDGVAAVVELKKNRAILTMAREMNDEEIKKIVDEAGFKVTSIKEG